MKSTKRKGTNKRVIWNARKREQTARRDPFSTENVTKLGRPSNPIPSGTASLRMEKPLLDKALGHGKTNYGSFNKYVIELIKADLASGSNI